MDLRINESVIIFFSLLYYLFKDFLFQVVCSHILQHGVQSRKNSVRAIDSFVFNSNFIEPSCMMKINWRNNDNKIWKKQSVRVYFW